MSIKTFDKISISILTIGIGAFFYLLFPAKKTSVFLFGSGTGLATSLYVLNTKNKISQRSHQANLNLNSLIIAAPQRQDNESQNDFTSTSSNESSKYIVENTVEKIIKWLENQKINPKNYQTPQSCDYTYDRITIALGENYVYLRKLYKKIKQRLNNGDSFRLSLINKTAQEISIITLFCQQLYKYTFLAQYRYNRETKTILATLNRTGDICSFFSGKWFERFVYLKVSQLLSQEGFDYQYSLNTQIITADGKDFELDILFAIGQEFFWIECKTGNYQNYINKYSQFRKSLGISKKNSLLVILDIDDRLANELTQMYEITVCNENLFLNHISKALSINFSEQKKIESDLIVSAPRTIKIKRQTISDRAKLKAILSKAKIRPYPEWRNIVLSHLITIITSNHYSPQTLKQIKEKISILIPGISNTNIMEIFNTLIMSGCLLDKNNQPIHSFNQNLNFLRSDCLDYLEQKCFENYVLITLLTDFDFFNSQSNLDDFRTTVGVASIENIELQDVKVLAEQVYQSKQKINTVYFDIQ
ncbi:MAG: hypothetical protein ACRC1Z_01390 [Waterburya sp.]